MPATSAAPAVPTAPTEPTGPTGQRRAYVRECLPGQTRISGPGIDEPLIGAIGDIGEGGVRVTVRGRPPLAQGWTVHTWTDLQAGGPAIDVVAHVLRIRHDDARWHLALRFPASHPYMDALRRAVFARQRHLARLRLDSLPAPGGREVRPVFTPA